MLVNRIATAVLLGIGINSVGFADRGGLVVVRCVIDGADVRRQLSWPVRVNYDGRLDFRILSGSSLF